MTQVIVTKEMIEFCQELKDLMEKHDMNIGVHIDGDTHGVRENFCLFDVKDKTARKECILSQGSSYLDASDLGEFIRDNSRKPKNPNSKPL